MRVRACLFAVTLAVTAAPSRGDEVPLPGTELLPSTSFVFTVGGASAPPQVFGGVHDPGRKTALLQLQVRRILARSEGRLFEWVFGIVPMELEAGTPVALESSLSQQLPTRSTVYGAGIDPLGLSMRFGNGPWRPFWTATGGLRLFVDRVPIPRGTEFNFAADIGVGVSRTLSPRWALSIGLGLHHVSNGNLGEKNPGVNYLLLTLGVWPTRS
jgi:hypothetical protein